MTADGGSFEAAFGYAWAALGGFSHQRAAYEEGWEAGYKAAVHDAYVNAQRAVAAIEFQGTSKMYRLGQEHMQEVAVRALRTAAEEAGK